MKIAGYAADADIFCVPCAEDIYASVEAGALDNEGNEIGVIFYDSEWDYLATCSVCHEELDVVMIYECDRCGEIEFIESTYHCTYCGWRTSYCIDCVEELDRDLMCLNPRGE